MAKSPDENCSPAPPTPQVRFLFLTFWLIEVSRLQVPMQDSNLRSLDYEPNDFPLVQSATNLIGDALLSLLVYNILPVSVHRFYDIGGLFFRIIPKCPYAAPRRIAFSCCTTSSLGSISRSANHPTAFITVRSRTSYGSCPRLIGISYSARISSSGGRSSTT